MRLMLIVTLVILAFIPAVSAQQVDIKKGREAILNGAVVIDVRTDKEWEAGHFPAALHMQNTKLAGLISQANLDKDTPIVLYCRSGNRATASSQQLIDMGYTNVINAGGLKDIQDLIPLIAEQP
ncbi:MAG: rhodanese-like domain-containing protein [Glaciecola sp.]|jgi:phage shock protein E